MTELISNTSNPSDPDYGNKMLEDVLINPVIEECDELRVVSGYVSSAMVKRHLEMLDKLAEKTGIKVKLKIIVGMIPKDGLSIIEHTGFKNLVADYQNLKCSYMMIAHPPCHSKLYVWFKNEQPYCAYVGSANYSQNAFFGSQIEIMNSCDPVSASSYFDSLVKDTAYCDHSEIEDMVQIVSEKTFRKKIRHIEETPAKELKGIVSLSLLSTKTNEMGDTSSLNWGQREKRDPDQAYIPISRDVARSGFFPEKGTVFTVMTDDGFTFYCVTAQNRKTDPLPKAIETCNNNSELGKYFRNRLGLESGVKVTKKDLERYGRTTVDFIDLQDGTYYMDFSKPKKNVRFIG